MAYVRKVRTASGAVAVQVVRKDRWPRRSWSHVGSAHTDAELGILLERARRDRRRGSTGARLRGAGPHRVVSMRSPTGVPVTLMRLDRPPRGLPAAPGRTRRPVRGCSTTCSAASMTGSVSTRSAMRCSGTW